jgi:hypothetical protein
LLLRCCYCLTCYKVAYLLAAALAADDFWLAAGLLMTGRCSKLLLLFLVIPADAALEQLRCCCCCWWWLCNMPLPLLLVPGLLLLAPLPPLPDGEAERGQLGLSVESCDILLLLRVLLGLLFLPDTPEAAPAAVGPPLPALPADAPLLNGLGERCCGCCSSSCTSGKLLLRLALLALPGTALPLVAGMCGDAVMLLLLCLLRGLLEGWLGELLPPTIAADAGTLPTGEPAWPVLRLVGCREASMLLNVAAGPAATGGQT